MLMVVIPLVTLADIPSPTYITRLRRVGYEVLPEAQLTVPVNVNQEKRAENEVDNSDWDGLGLIFVAAGLGLFILFTCVLPRARKTFALIPLAMLGWYFWNEQPIRLTPSATKGEKASRTLAPAEFPEEEQLHRRPNYSGVLHSNDPGWKFPEQVTAEEKTEIERKIMTVRDDLQRKVDADRVWVCGDYYHRGRHSMKRAQLFQLHSLLERHPELIRKCAGIPIEWLVNAVRWDVHHWEGSWERFGDGQRNSGWGDDRPGDEKMKAWARENNASGS